VELCTLTRETAAQMVTTKSRGTLTFWTCPLFQFCLQSLSLHPSLNVILHQFGFIFHFQCLNEFCLLRNVCCIVHLGKEYVYSVVNARTLPFTVPHVNSAVFSCGCYSVRWCRAYRFLLGDTNLFVFVRYGIVLHA
jgi:hypothetical protein